MVDSSKLQNVDWSQLPAPLDDGAADHLVGARLPDLALPSTLGPPVNLSQLTGLTVIYTYPMTGRPGVALPTGWDAIPGARGCTPQACAFRDHTRQLHEAGVDALFGVSIQSSTDQKEAADRLHLPFPLLSDASHAFIDALQLPTMTVDEMLMTRRLSLIARDAVVVAVFYPVFPPDQAPDEICRWLASHGD